MRATASAARVGSRWPAAEPRPPAPDRNERDVDRAELAHPVEEVGVAGEVDRLRARDDVAERIRRRTERPPAPVVLGRHRADLERADREASRRPRSRATLSNRRLRSRPPRPRGHDDRELLAEPLERRQVEVVVVRVRDRAPRRRRGACARRPAPSAGGARRGCAAADRSADERRRDRRRPSHARRIRFAPRRER